MYDPLIECKPDDKTVSVLGSDFALDESSDIKRLLKKYNYRIFELPKCKKLAGYDGNEQGKTVYKLLPSWKIRNGDTGKASWTRVLVSSWKF